MHNDFSNCKGYVQGIIEYKNGKFEKINFSNAVVKSGRSALAACLANNIGGDFDYFISEMIFGNGGAKGSSGGVAKQINDEATNLFGDIVARIPVISNIDPNNTAQVIFTSVLPFDTANGQDINEMGLFLNSGDLYSIATFSSISKSSEMQITWNWRLSFI